MILRDYQRQAVDAVWEHLRQREDNPCVALPTAAGKTLVIATICKEAVGLWNGRVIILAHVKELLQQSVDKLNLICPEIRAGVYSAGLGRRDTDHPVIVAGIQSVYRRADELGAFDLIIVDEAHLIPPDGEGMYRSFIVAQKNLNPQARVIGLTATPYRMSTGMICSPENILNHVCYEVGVKELIQRGFLCRLVGKAGTEKIDASELHIRGGEFVADEVEALMDQDALVRSACADIRRHTTSRYSCLIFAAGVNHAHHIAAVMAESGTDVAVVTGDTPSDEREATLGRFRSGSLPYLVNVNVLTTGFDAPNIDCVALVRPTMSPGLYYQMCGRGFRVSPGKKDCLILDFGGNIMRHGPVDVIRVHGGRPGTGPAPAKECPACHALIAAGYAICPECLYQFPVEERQTKHDREAADGEIISGETTVRDAEVIDVAYAVHKKRDNPDAPRTMRVEYVIGLGEYVSEWICFDHTGWAREKAASWWRFRSNYPEPDSVAEAVALAPLALARPSRISIQRKAGEKYDRIIGCEIRGDRPTPSDGCSDKAEVPALAVADHGEIPF